MKLRLLLSNYCFHTLWEFNAVGSFVPSITDKQPRVLGSTRETGGFCAKTCILWVSTRPSVMLSCQMAGAMFCEKSGFYPWLQEGCGGGSDLNLMENFDFRTGVWTPPPLELELFMENFDNMETTLFSTMYVVNMMRFVSESVCLPCLGASVGRSTTPEYHTKSLPTLANWFLLSGVQ